MFINRCVDTTFKTEWAIESQLETGEISLGEAYEMLNERPTRQVCIT